jgi:hypothetical protein
MVQLDKEVHVMEIDDLISHFKHTIRCRTTAQIDGHPTPANDEYEIVLEQEILDRLNAGASAQKKLESVKNWEHQKFTNVMQGGTAE